MKDVALGDFLRARRASLAPDEGEVTSAPLRRVPGLRREEVARLVGVSVDYYVKLEQGHRIPSEGVLHSLAEVLQLDQAAREHMRNLAWRDSQPNRHPGSTAQHVRPGMFRLMESFGGLPVVLLGRRTDILAANPTARLLFADFNAMPAHERNAIRFALLSERARELHLDWESIVAGFAGMLRMDAGRHPDDPRTAELINDLCSRSRYFARVWSGYHVATSVVPESKLIEHPVVGRVRFQVEAVTTPQDPDQVLQVLFPASDPASQSAARDLLALAGVK
ncbi:helix-turn-helix domain-containing protein [Actinopolymorpha pittospori]|uniref:Transcriptional regulator with XRE-family HTH domain n=1 Tax=Actinopolymorpha pittospori TaxID=648752 RepID=A0A927R7U9_9ACTN|nr:transcriptional regulator with XRE-family HTH domain [Actinopolymorpha pittospori]